MYIILNFFNTSYLFHYFLLLDIYYKHMFYSLKVLNYDTGTVAKKNQSIIVKIIPYRT
jgi:hypothetical protein